MKKKVWTTLVLLLGAMAAGIATAQEEVATPEAAAPPTSIDELAWLAGCWIGETGDVKTEECWLAPRGGSMVGINRRVGDGETIGFEYLRIDGHLDGLAYRASPQGRCPETVFALVELSGEKAVFENLGHDFPQRILYWREGDVLHARIESEGQSRSAEWTWTRAAW